MEQRKDSGVKMFLRQFAVFGLSEAVVTTLLAPLERYKLLRQTTPLAKAGPAYRSLFSYLTQAPSSEGFLAFWRGNLTSVCRNFFTSVLRFRFHTVFMGLYLSGKPEEDSNLWTRSLMHETTLGLFLLLFTYPIDQIRVRLAVDVVPKGKDRNYFGFSDCLGKTIKGEGIKGSYQGLGITSLALGPYLAVGSLLDQELKAYIPEGYELHSRTYALLLLQTLFYPADTIRRRLQTNGARGQLRLYANTRDCIAQTWRSEGIAGFFAGLPVHLLRLLPSLYLFHTLTHLDY